MKKSSFSDSSEEDVCSSRSAKLVYVVLNTSSVSLASDVRMGEITSEEARFVSIESNLLSVVTLDYC